ncbi:MAG: sugar nucleotide-binding protein [Alphaproteobacteria bacterium]|nr:sugar nucleotide-binding protein [Alphaproteobacteria bacterium]
MSSVLVIGANGQVGSAALGYLAGRGHEVSGTTRRVSGENEKHLFLDLGLPPQEWPDLPPVDAAVICTAMTRIDECEDDPDGAAVVNLHAPVALAEKLTRQGTTVVFLSTTGVFDFTRPYRRRDESPCPVSAYGRQKAEAEARILALDGKTAVLRLTKIMGPDMPLLKAWRDDLAAGREITAYEDAFIAPITAAFAARMICEVVSGGAEGVFHASGDEDVPYTVLAEQLVRAMGADLSLVKTVEGGLPHYPTANAPRYTTLDMSREGEMFGVPAPSSLATMRETVEFLASNGLSLPPQVPSAA